MITIRACDLALPTNPLTHYVIVRTDIPVGAQIAQSIHAAGESVTTRVPSGTFAVALAASDEATLLKLEGRLIAAGIPHTAVREPDPPHFNALMAIGIAPMERATLRKLLGGFRLVK